jgi:hypothetical protein
LRLDLPLKLHHLYSVSRGIIRARGGLREPSWCGTTF